MTQKKFWKESFVGLVIKNVLIAGIISLVLIWVTFKFIDKYTEHGITEIVPDLRGAYFEEAEILLKSQKLYPQIIDSIYSREKPLGTIVEQIPAPGSTIKHNRPIYLIVNSRNVKKVPLPTVLDFSSRQTSAMIHAIGINVDSIQYVPSEYKDLVIDITYKGESVTSGHLIPEGESVVLIVGSGLGEEEITVPNLRGFTIEQARSEIIFSKFILGATHYDDKGKGKEEDYIIYRQSPVHGKTVSSGTRIDLWLSTDRSLLDKAIDNNLDNQEEEFF